jgi:integrase
MRCLTPAEANAFLLAAREDRWHPLWEILTLSGLRPGEAFGLKWSDITGNTIAVQRALLTAGEKWVIAEPKTRRSRRTVPLAESTMKALQKYRRLQAQEKLKAGANYRDNDFIFANSTGLPLDIKNITARHFRKVLAAAGLPKIRLYDLRHTAATLMLAAESIRKWQANVWVIQRLFSQWTPTATFYPTCSRMQLIVLIAFLRTRVHKNADLLRDTGQMRSRHHGSWTRQRQKLRSLQ